MRIAAAGIVIFEPTCRGREHACIDAGLPMALTRIRPCPVFLAEEEHLKDSESI